MQSIKINKEQDFTIASNLRIERPQKKIALPTMEGIYFENISDIIYLQADGNYVYVHLKNDRKFLISKTLSELETLLHRHPRFVRIHRSNTINLDLLAKYVRGKGGHVEMSDGTKINVSLGKKQDFLAALGRYFG